MQSTGSRQCKLPLVVNLFILGASVSFAQTTINGPSTLPLCYCQEKPANGNIQWLLSYFGSNQSIAEGLASAESGPNGISDYLIQCSAALQAAVAGGVCDWDSLKSIPNPNTTLPNTSPISATHAYDKTATDDEKKLVSAYVEKPGLPKHLYWMTIVRPNGSDVAVACFYGHEHLAVLKNKEVSSRKCKASLGPAPSSFEDYAGLLKANPTLRQNMLTAQSIDE
jgi:hypothetical protein